MVGAAAVVLFIVMCRNGLVVMLVSPDLARTAEQNVKNEERRLTNLLAQAATESRDKSPRRCRGTE